MIATNYQHFGGRHFASAVMKNTLAHAGVVAPHSGEPLSEPMCFGIAGGIGVGYSFCPSIAKHDLEQAGPPPPLDPEMDNEAYNERMYRYGSGLGIVGRHKVYTTGGDYYSEFYKRLGIKTTIKESGGSKAAHGHLVDALTAGRPAIVWLAPMRQFFLGWCGTWGMYTAVVHALDEERGEVQLGDRSPTSVSLPVDDLIWSRNRVCSLKNRLLTFQPPSKLTAATLKKAVTAGLKACVSELLQPKMKTFGPPGLIEWSKMINNSSHKKGWRKVYPGGHLYLPLRDVFDSIETAGTGGGLFRPMFAEFLDEAAEVTGKKRLAAMAGRYRELGEQWSQLAAAVLPDSVKPFKKTRQLLGKRRDLYEQKGHKAARQLTKVIADLNLVELQMRAQWPLDDDATSELLEQVREQIVSVHAAEVAAAEELQSAVGK